jgi:hypothetical protein
VAAVRPITAVGSSSSQGNVSTPNGVVPAATSPGDQLLMALSLNDATRTIGTTTGVTGWTLVGTAVSGTMRTTVYTKTAVTGDAGRAVRFSLDAAAKYTLTIAAYSGDMVAPEIVMGSETVLRPTHTTPVVQARAGDWAVSSWADKSSATTAFALPAEVTQRQALCGANAGRVCSVLADSAGPVAAGPYGALSATADAASASATTWTMVLHQAG